MKRLYREAIATQIDDGWSIALDGVPARTPADHAIVVPNAALASAIAAEWQAQGDEIRLDSLELTRLAATAIDLVRDRRDVVVDELLKYADTDLLCYRASRPAELVARQEQLWQPLLDWALQRFDADLIVTSDVVPLAQPASGVGALRNALSAYSDMELTALRLATATAGSLVIALALIERRLDSESAFAAAEIDESVQISRWGEDTEQTKRRAALKADLTLAARFAALAWEEPGALALPSA
jgi:chaperone required for assembly of F1-ATPase